MSVSKQEEMASDQQQEDTSPTSDKKNEKVQIDRLPLILDFGKFTLGTVLIGIVTLLVNCRIQERQEEMTKLQNEREFIGKFVEQAIDENLEARIRFSHYFVTLTDPEDDPHKRWQAYYDYLLASATEVAEDLKVTQTAAEEQQATATVQAKVTATYIAEQQKENPTEFPLTATQIAIESKMREEQLLQGQQAIQRLESELIRVVTSTPIPPETSTFTPTPTPSSTPTGTFTPTPTPSSTATSTFTPTPTPSSTPTSTFTPTPTVPELLQPENKATRSVNEEIRFEWRGSLADDERYVFIIEHDNCKDVRGCSDVHWIEDRNQSYYVLPAGRYDLEKSTFLTWKVVVAKANDPSRDTQNPDTNKQPANPVVSSDQREFSLRL